MRKELETKLLSDFPKLYADIQYNEFECADGWYDIIYRLSIEIANIISTHNMDPNVYSVFQVKEKWGVLRVYMNRYTEELHEVVGRAQKESEVTCETCGAEGKLMTDKGDVRTTCDGCETARREREAQWRERSAQAMREMEKDSGPGLDGSFLPEP